MSKFEIGIDEVGRGCLAGPVVVASVLIPTNFKPPKELPTLQDSKKMTAEQREKWVEWVKSGRINFAVAFITTEEIEKLNISGAANLGAWQSLTDILKDCPNIEVDIVLDGGLFVKDKNFQEELLKEKEKISSIKTITGADDKFNSVKLASVIAKVLRDEYMQSLSVEYPAFGFESHKGYGTTEHKRAIENNGLIEGVHRKQFCGDNLL